MIEESDEIVWNKCIVGEKEAFKEIYQRYFPLLLNYGYKLTANKDLIEDTIQDLFLKMMLNHKSLSPSLCLKGYILLSFRNKLFDSLKRSSNIPIDYNFSISDLEIENEDDNIVENENIKLLLKAVKELNTNQSEILYLHFVCGLKHQDISKMLKINLQSSKNLLSRSLIKLKNLYFKQTCKK
ncbi:MAG: sigma-70 family RNA polymerase sigma factor [Bacteroidales bacterium]|nr:sigma-70 family RNA polymerase sigma factor [Bacteroidales bacterium]